MKNSIPSGNKNPKVAIVCDWLTNMGGAERVVLQMHKMYPDAPIFTSSYDPAKMPLFKNADVRASYINRLPMGKKHQLWPVLRRWYFGNLKLKDYDLVLSSSGAEAKAVCAPNGIHIDYCHSPTHYYWVRPDEYQSSKSAGNTLMRVGLKILKPWMERWDYKAAQRPDIVLANSSVVKERIQKYYDRQSIVVNPPVDDDRFHISKSKKGDCFVVLGRQVHYMRKDLAISAFNGLGSKYKLKVIGRGPEHQNLVMLAADSNIEFLSDLDDDQVAAELAGAKALIAPGIEDFCITAVEAMASGIPVIGIRGGGILDSVVEGTTGVFFDQQTPESIMGAVKSFKPGDFDPQQIRAHSQKFKNSNFRKNLQKVIDDALDSSAD